MVWTFCSKENYEKILAYIAGITGLIFLAVLVTSISKSVYKFPRVLLASSPCVLTLVPSMQWHHAHFFEGSSLHMQHVQLLKLEIHLKTELGQSDLMA